MVAALLTNRLIHRPPRSYVARCHQVARPEFMVSLGLGPPYRVDDVKRAYLERAKLIHPDKGGSMPQFLRLQDAFERATEDGYWYADIAPTAIGSKHRYRIVNGDMSQCRMMKGMTDRDDKSAGPAKEHQQEHK